MYYYENVLEKDIVIKIECVKVKIGGENEKQWRSNTFLKAKRLHYGK